MEQDLISFFTTKAQANEFSARLTAVAEKIYETHFSLEKTVASQLGITKSDKFLKLLREHNVRSDSPTEIKSFIATVQKTIQTLPVVSITLAFEPTDATLAALSDWFVINCKKQFLFDFTVDQRLIAGAIIKYNGTYLDSSSKAVFDKVVEEAAKKKMQPIPAAKPLVGKHLIEHFHLGR